MKLIGPPRTELWHILAVYIMCLCDLYFFKFSNSIFLTPFFPPPKWHYLGASTYNSVLCVGMCAKMRPVGVAKKNWKRIETLIRQTGYLPRPPSRHAPKKLSWRSCPGASYRCIFEVSWKSVEGSRTCGGSKIALSHWFGPWPSFHGLQPKLRQKS